MIKKYKTLFGNTILRSDNFHDWQNLYDSMHDLLSEGYYLIKLPYRTWFNGTLQCKLRNPKRGKLEYKLKYHGDLDER